MIKVNKSIVVLKGNAPELCAELSIICKNLWELLQEKYPENIAKQIIIDSVETGFKSKEEIKKEAEKIEEITEKLRKILNEKGEK